ncbi:MULTISPECIES: anti-sigma factor antagonist [Parabacteroides]|uniref:anti-sigma factor antagonist n=1 Tax=Parabacteroides leei TaxID=2939491 RepID=UPI00189A9570|nr:MULTISPECIES: anti-sigma factor antagonist [Parabacteroides]MCL3850495.1 anti-sigma factor antagonist [Parabacteroides leei]
MEKEIIIENDSSEIIRITRFIESLGVSLFLPSATTRRICLAIEEAVSCTIHHAYPNGAKGKIKLKVSQVNGDINCMIINDGMTFDPTLPQNKSEKSSLEDMLTGGLGFFLIFRTMDEIAFHTDGSQNFLMLTKGLGAIEEPESSLNTNICKVAGGVIITVEGRLDTLNARKFESVIRPVLDNGTPEIVINCENLTYISSSGLRCFILMQKKVDSSHGLLVLKGVLPEIRNIFDMTGCSSLFTIH